MDNNMVSKIRVGMYTTNIHLLQFKIENHLQKRDKKGVCEYPKREGCHPYNNTIDTHTVVFLP